MSSRGRGAIPFSTWRRARYAVLAMLCASVAAHADAVGTAASSEAPALNTSTLRPWGFFAQFGIADEVTAGTAGLMWSLHGDKLRRKWSIHLEASVSRWQTRGGQPSQHGVLTQVALIPVIRRRLDEGRSRLFLEGGIGATVTSSVFRSGNTRFSTAFNFGDHLGAGYSFDKKSRDEIVLRIEHFSNAGIKHPNPGENFLELRFVHRFE